MEINFIIKSVFVSNGKYYIFESDKFEARENFNKRSWFIIRCLENTENELTIYQLIIKIF